MARLWFRPILLLAALLLPAAALAISTTAPPARIVAVGDLHGDYAAWRAIAGAAGLINAKGHWTGGKTMFVQVGDIVDRAPDSLKIIRDLMRIEREAEARGGHVVVLVGNHEAMMMTGDFRYTHPGEFAAFADRRSEQRRADVYDANLAAIETAYRAREPALTAAAIRDRWIAATPLGMIEYRRAWAPDGELGKWTLGHRAVVKIGGSLFVHGGISSVYLNLSIDEINRQVTAALAAADKAPTSIINDPMGPLWYRGLVTRSPDDEPPLKPATLIQPPPRPTIDLEIGRVVRAYGVKRIIIGHTPTLGGIVEGAGGRLWRIDSAISIAYGGTPSYLEIFGDRLVAHKVPRPVTAGQGEGQ